MRNVFFTLFISLLLSISCDNQNIKDYNFIIIYVDDMGYGDVGSYGHPTIKTPNLDQMASEGMRFTQFYVGSSICTPSRAALLTGKLPIQTGMYGKRSVLFPDNAGGLDPKEITIAAALKKQNYKSILTANKNTLDLTNSEDVEQFFKKNKLAAKEKITYVGISSKE